jgi:hypothetical protein
MKHIFQIGLFLLFFEFCPNGFSKDNSHNIGLMLDLGGKSGGYSITGEYQICTINGFKLNAILGFGYLPIKETNFLGIPIGINLLTGVKKHHIELGIGTSYLKGLSFRIIGNGGNNKYYPTDAIYFAPSIGYRFDKCTNGLIFKVYYSPLIVIYDLIDKHKFINEVTKDVVLFGTTTKEDYFNYFYGDRFLPKATNKYGYFGISLGYRF